jgi:hypothetical protein
MEEKINDSRRSAFKKIGKTAAFVIPTIVTFKVSAITVVPSGRFSLSEGEHKEEMRHV